MAPRALTSKFQDHVLGFLYFLQLRGTVSSVISARYIKLTNVLKSDPSVVRDRPLHLELAPPLGLRNDMGFGMA